MWGKKRLKESIEKTASANAKPFKLLSPNGLVVEGINLNKFARENGLNTGHLREVMFNLRYSHKGWKNIDSIECRPKIIGVKKVYGNKFSANVNYKNKRYYFGVFDTLEDAARKVDIESIRIKGNLCHLNFEEKRHEYNQLIYAQ